MHFFNEEIYETTSYKYCKDIAEGKIISNKWIKLQSEMFLDDIEKSKSDDFKWYFDCNIANSIEEFAGLMKFTEGHKEGQRMVLSRFQANICQQMYGWRSKEDREIKRYREVICYMPRKNGKSYMNSMIALLALMLETNAEVVNGATALKQAQILVDMAIKSVQTNSSLAKHFNIYKKHLEFKGSKFEAVSSKPKDGANYSHVIIDEAMEVEKKLKDSLTSGFMQRKSPQTVYISTHYPTNLENNWFWEKLNISKEVLQGNIANERILPFIYCLDNKDEVNNESSWLKANPILEDVPYDGLRSDYEAALHNPAEFKNLLIRNFNVYIDDAQDDLYIKMSKWKKCGVDKIDLEGKEVLIGLDASRTTDLTAISFVYKEDGIYNVKSIGFIPEDTLFNRREKIDYRKLAEKEECFIIEGDVIDDEYLEQFIYDIPKKYGCEIREIYADPYNVSRMLQRLGRSFDVVDVRQGYTLSPALKHFRDQVYLGKVKYEKSQLFDWCMSNCHTKPDRNDNELLIKSNKNKTRIDLVASLITVMTGAMNEKEEFSLGNIFIG